MPPRRGENCSLSTSLHLALPKASQDVPHPRSQGKGVGHCAHPWIWHLRYVLRSLTPSNVARVLTSCCLRASLGVAELLIFHPVDTIAKRLMSNKAKVLTFLLFYTNAHDSNSQVSFPTLSPIIFREYSTAPLGRKLLSLFPGLGYAACYKVSQRVYKFGGQPWINDVLVRNYKTGFTNLFGERKGRMMMQATAGSLTGIGEVVLLPLDALKIKRQVNPDAFRGRGVIRIFMEEGTTLYRGWGWTVARNAPGSFAVGCFPQ
jgi:hypothetical protein